MRYLSKLSAGKIVATAVALLLGVQGAAQAVNVLNIDFQPTINDPSVTTNTYTVNYTGTAAAPDTGTVWNSLNAANTSPAVFIGEPGYYDEVNGAISTYLNLTDSKGAATPIDISFTSGGAFAVENSAPNMPNIATNAQGLMRDYLIAFRDGGQGGPRTVTISGLDPNEQMILYLYGEGDNLSNDRQTSFNANGVTGSTVGDAPADSPLTEGADYVRLTGVVADPSGVLTIQYSANGTPEGPFNGLQLLYNLDVGIPGDTDGDNDVDMNDYVNIRNNFRNSGLLTRMQGDIAGPNSGLVGDGVVDFYDFIAWQDNFPTPGAGGGAGASVGVPEPSTVLLMLCGVGLFATGRRRTSP
ncbi:MAG: PEP-CTERM sorting domain-containing protein [Pirellulales bacterium]